MADGVISFPFRLTPQGHVATALHGSDQEVEELLAALVLTHIGERPMEPDFGIPDPTWVGITLNDVETGLAEFGPPGVTIDSLDEEPLTDTQSSYVLSWSREPVDQESL